MNVSMLNVIKLYIFQTTINADGLNTMIISLLEVPMVTEYHPNGTDGCIINMMMNHSLIAILSKTLSLKNLINGINRHQSSNSTYPKLLSFILNFWNIEKIGKTSSPLNGPHQQEEHDYFCLINRYQSIIFCHLSYHLLNYFFYFH